MFAAIGAMEAAISHGFRKQSVRGQRDCLTYSTIL
jgi:hypothetical protein